MMLKALNEFFDKAFAGKSEEATENRQHALQVATAMLLIEVARADYQDDLVEDQAVFAEIKKFFALDDHETGLLLAEARRTADGAVSLQQFTRRLHEQLSLDEKHRVIEMLWKVAFADNRLDKYEDYVVRKVADLLYVTHAELIRIRNKVREPGA